ncbi:MAG: fatty acid desaturase family protein [Actinomycetota bacterium]|nr:fatty acid desaturase family protein [Actinomycetota bacterium]
MRTTAASSTGSFLDTLVPPPSALPDVLPTERLNKRGMPVRELRDDLRRIPNLRNGVAVVSCLAQTVGVVVLAAVIGTWWAWLAAFVLMGRGHAMLNSLAHEAAHRLLFTNRRANDLVGRWLLGYPSFTAVMAYRRAHMSHHRDELGPEEPDLALYAGYPVPADSWRRKLRRDATGVSAYKNVRSMIRGARAGSRELRQVLALHAVALVVCVVLGQPLAYVVWFASWATLWKVVNRLRAIAEHGGMVRSPDRRLTTHVIRQRPLARFYLVPYNIGWHLAHHADMGVPWNRLPELHRELVDSGWVTEEITYPNYRAFWKACSSGAPRARHTAA